MKEVIATFTKYNVWANKLLSQELINLHSDEYVKIFQGSFPTILETIEHIWFAESVWLQRLQMQEHIVKPSKEYSGGIKKACELWLASSEELHEFATKIYDDRGLEHEFHYYDLAGNFHKSKVWECLQHVCNHSTFHRGQLITYVRQLGKTTIPSTDFITFTRGKNK